MKNLLKKFVKDEQGLELSEYAVMIAIIIAVSVGVLTAISGHLTRIFGLLRDALAGVV